MIHLHESLTSDDLIAALRKLPSVDEVEQDGKLIVVYRDDNCNFTISNIGTQFKVLGQEESGETLGSLSSANLKDITKFIVGA